MSSSSATTAAAGGAVERTAWIPRNTRLSGQMQMKFKNSHDTFHGFVTFPIFQTAIVPLQIFTSASAGCRDAPASISQRTVALQARRQSSTTPVFCASRTPKLCDVS